jgi:hypothetical protein
LDFSQIEPVTVGGALYAAKEIARRYQTLNRSPAPLGHPLVNGKLVSVLREVTAGGDGSRRRI